MYATTRHDWHYMYRQQPGEPLVFLQFDNSTRVDPQKKALLARVPHSALVDEEAEVMVDPKRMSIEARAFVFYDEECVQLLDGVALLGVTA